MAAHPLRGEHLPRSSRPCFCATPNTPAALLPEPVALGKISASAGLWGRERSRFSPRGGGAGRAQGSCCPARGRGAGAAFPGLCPAAPIPSGPAALSPVWVEEEENAVPWSTWLRTRLRAGHRLPGQAALPSHLQSAERRCMTNLLTICDALMIPIDGNWDVCERGSRSLLHSAQTRLLITPNMCKSS